MRNALTVFLAAGLAVALVGCYGAAPSDVSNSQPGPGDAGSDYTFVTLKVPNMV